MTRAWNACVLTVLAVIVTIVATMDTGRAAAGYSTYSIRGTYRITYTGLSLPSMVPESGIGVFVADGTGHLTGTEVVNAGGLLCPNVAVTGAYTVDVSNHEDGEWAHIVLPYTPGSDVSGVVRAVGADDGRLGDRGFEKPATKRPVPGSRSRTEDCARGPMARALGSASSNSFHFRLFEKEQSPEATCLAGLKQV